METANNPSNNALNPKVILSICLDKWRWFIFSLVVVMGAAVLYLLCTPSVYLRTASLLVKENSNGQSGAGSISSMFADMGLNSVNTDVNNELITIQSPTILNETVKRLNLDVDYSVKGWFHNRTVYGTELPVKVSFIGLDDNMTFSMELELEENNRIRFSTFDNPELEGKNFSGRLNDTLSIGIGKMVVTPTIYYDEEAAYPVFCIRRSSILEAQGKCKSNFSAILNSGGTTVIDLFYNDVSTQRAEDVLNTIITIYNENWLKDKNQVTVSTSQFINERLGVIERELGDVDEDISTFKSAHLLPDINAVSGLYLSQSQANSNQLLALNTQLSMARQIRSHVASSTGKNQFLPANLGLGSSGIEQQIAEYNTTQLQRNNLVSNSSDQNPLVLDMDQSLESMRRAILSSIDNFISSVQTQIASLRHSEERTNTQIAEAPDQTKYLQAVGRQQKVKEELYLFLLQKREENELSQAFTAYNTRLITPPNGNFIPVAPKKKNILLMAFVIGLLLPVVVIVLKEGANTTIRGRKDLASLSLPFLGEIPLLVKPGTKKRNRMSGRNKVADEGGVIAVKAGSRNMINEAFRVLRTNLEFISNKNPEKNVYVFTSFNPGSGKTFITLNSATLL